MLKIAVLAIALQAPADPQTSEPSQAAVLDGVTFASQPEELHVPLREVCQALDIPLGFNGEGRIQVAGIVLAENGPMLPAGHRLIPVRELSRWDTQVRWNQETQTADLTRLERQAQVRLGQKSVRIDKSTQTLVAKQGERVVLETKVSTGRLASSTPNGEFSALMKKRMHYSSLYDNAPMPYSVQVVGNIFIHGYHSVPNRPASHGCIRLPLHGQAEFFWEWIEIGTPVVIEGSWTG
jgi:lipoprotein-anchoring transpeptidase ErfK/SrfK